MEKRGKTGKGTKGEEKRGEMGENGGKRGETRETGSGADHGNGNTCHHMSNVLLVCLASHSTTTAQVLSNRCLYPVHPVYPSLSTTTVQVMTDFLQHDNIWYVRIGFITAKQPGNSEAWIKGCDLSRYSECCARGLVVFCLRFLCECFVCVLYVSVLYTNPYHLSHHPHHRFQGTRRPEELQSWHQSLVLMRSKFVVGVASITLSIWYGK